MTPRWSSGQDPALSLLGPSENILLYSTKEKFTSVLIFYNFVSLKTNRNNLHLVDGESNPGHSGESAGS